MISSDTRPKGWEVKTIQQLIDDESIIDHLDGNHGELYPKSEEFTKSGIPYISANNFIEGFVDFESCKYLPEERAKKLKKGIAINNDVLFAHNATVGPVALLKTDFKYVILSTTATYFRCNNKKLSNTFLSFALQSPAFVSQYTSIMGQSTRNQVPITAQRKLHLMVPSLMEQTAIANLLSTWDRSINTLTQLIVQKELRKKWLMQQLLTGKKRLKGFKGKWGEVKLKEIFNEITDTNDGGDSHSIMTISSRLGLISQEDKFDRVIAGDSLKKYTQLKKHDFAYNKGNSKTYPMGCIYQLEEKESALVPFVYICFSPTKLVDPKFYKQWFSAHGLDRQLNRIITSGARGDGLLNVNTDDFFGLKVPYPKKEEQTAIARVLQAADVELKLLNQKLDKLKEQKKGLMQVLLTGKKRLKY